MKGKKYVYPSCVFAKAKRRNWRGRGDPDSLRSATQVNPGDCISIDQVISVHPSLVPRIDGHHSRDRIHHGTVFFDNVSTLSLTHLQCSTGGIKTIAAKQSYENCAGSFEIMVKAYHADNGIFAEKSFRDEVAASNQIIDYYDVGVHH